MTVTTVHSGLGDDVDFVDEDNNSNNSNDNSFFNHLHRPSTFPLSSSISAIVR